MKAYAAIALLALTTAVTPSLAQTSAPTATTPPATAKSMADCEANWKVADKNNDGMLNQTEISASKALMPTSMTADGAVAKQTYLSACSTNVQGQKK